MIGIDRLRVAPKVTFRSLTTRLVSLKYLSGFVFSAGLLYPHVSLSSLRHRCDITWMISPPSGRERPGRNRKPCEAYNGGQKVKIFKMFVVKKNNLASYIYIWDVMGLKKQQLGGAVGVINWYNFGEFTNNKLGYSPYNYGEINQPKVDPQKNIDPTVGSCISQWPKYPLL